MNLGDAEAWFNMGNDLLAWGVSDKARAYYDRVLEIQPRHTEAWFSKGNALQMSQSHRPIHGWSIAIENAESQKEAILCYDKVLEIQTKHVEALINKGNSLGSLGRYEEAVTCYDEALKIQLNLTEAWFKKGRALQDLGNLQQAAECFDKALKLEPILNGGLVKDEKDLGNSHLIAHYGKTLKLEPRKVTSWFTGAIELIPTGKGQEVARFKNYILHIAPPNNFDPQKDNNIIIYSP